MYPHSAHWLELSEEASEQSRATGVAGTGVGVGVGVTVGVGVGVVGVAGVGDGLTHSPYSALHTNPQPAQSDWVRVFTSLQFGPATGVVGVGVGVGVGAGLQLCGVVNTPPVKVFPASSFAHAVCNPVAAAEESE